MMLSRNFIFFDDKNYIFSRIKAENFTTLGTLFHPDAWKEDLQRSKLLEIGLIETFSY